MWGSLAVAAGQWAEGRGPPAGRPLEGASVYPQCRISGVACAINTSSLKRLGKSADTMSPQQIPRRCKQVIQVVRHLVPRNYRGHATLEDRFLREALFVNMSNQRHYLQFDDVGTEANGGGKYPQIHGPTDFTSLF